MNADLVRFCVLLKACIITEFVFSPVTLTYILKTKYICTVEAFCFYICLVSQMRLEFGASGDPTSCSVRKTCLEPSSRYLVQISDAIHHDHLGGTAITLVRNRSLQPHASRAGSDRLKTKQLNPGRRWFENTGPL